MRLSVSDIDFSKLSAGERRTLEEVVPKIEDGFSVKEIAAELGVDAQQLQDDVDRLGARMMALAGIIDLPPLSDDEREALKESLRVHGQQQPILRGSASSGLPGEIVDGHTRRSLCAELGIEPWIVDIDGGADQLRSLALVLNLARRHMSTSARRGIVRAKILADPAQSDRAIAAAVGVSPTTVGAVRRELEQSGKVSKLDTRTGRDGVQQTARRAERAPQPLATHRSIRVQVPVEMFEQWVGDWTSCSAFRLLERRPGVFELDVRLLDPAALGADQRAAMSEAIGKIADSSGDDPAAIAAELLAIASAVFARSIESVDDLSVEEADWLISRAGSILPVEAST